MLDLVSRAAVEARTNAIYDAVGAIVDVHTPPGERLMAHLRARPESNYEVVWGRGKDRRTESTGTRDHEEAQRFLRRKQFQLDTSHMAAADPRRLPLSNVLRSARGNYEIKFPADAHKRSSALFAEMRPKAARLLAMLGHLKVGELRQETLNLYREVCRGRLSIIGGKRLDGLAQPLSQSTIARDTEWLIRLINETLAEAKVSWRPTIVSLDRVPRAVEFLTEDEFWRLCAVFEHGYEWDETADDWRSEPFVNDAGVTERRYVSEPIVGGVWKLRFIIIAAFSGTREKRIRNLRWLLSPDKGCIEFRSDDRVVMHRRGYGEDPSEGKPAESAFVLPFLAECLRRWSEEDMECGSFYVVHQNGRPIRSNPSDEIAKAARRAGIKKHVTCHVLKHTAMTMMLNAGMNPHQAGNLGSTSAGIVEKVYHHWTLDESKELEAYDGIFGAPLVLS